MKKKEIAIGGMRDIYKDVILIFGTQKFGFALQGIELEATKDGGRANLEFKLFPCGYVKKERVKK